MPTGDSLICCYPISWLTLWHVPLPLCLGQTEADILVRKELDDLAAKHPDRFTLWYTLSRGTPDGWAYSEGRHVGRRKGCRNGQAHDSGSCSRDGFRHSNAQGSVCFGFWHVTRFSRVTEEMMKAHLPPPADDTAILSVLAAPSCRGCASLFGWPFIELFHCRRVSQPLCGSSFDVCWPECAGRSE